MFTFREIIRVYRDETGVYRLATENGVVEDFEIEPDHPLWHVIDDALKSWDWMPSDYDERWGHSYEHRPDL